MASEAPKPNEAAPAQGSGQNAPQTAGMSAPIPAAAPTVDKNSVMSVSEAERLATANDVAACRDASRKLRIAGVTMPNPLLALTALDMKFQNTAAPPPVAPAVAPVAPTP